MSDNEEPKKSGYRVEYASSARSKCKGPKPCAGTAIPKGEIRLGSLVDVRGQIAYAWRHWGCVTPKIISNMKKQFSAGAEDLDGFEDLKDEDKARIHLAFKEGKVADEDIPDTARKPLDATSKGDDKPKNKSSGKKKVGADIDEGDTEKPKGARVRKSRAKMAAALSEAEDGAESESKPQKKAPTKKSPVQKKAPAKRKAPKKKDESEISGDDDFAEAIGENGADDEHEMSDQAPKIKRKRPTTTKPASSSKKVKTVSSRQKKTKVVEADDDE